MINNVEVYFCESTNRWFVAIAMYGENSGGWMGSTEIACSKYKKCAIKRAIKKLDKLKFTLLVKG